jgi:hypothetical protein
MKPGDVLEFNSVFADVDNQRTRVEIWDWCKSANAMLLNVTYINPFPESQSREILSALEVC